MRMRKLTHKLVTAAMALSLASFYAGCSSSTDGVLAFFGITGSGFGTCTDVTLRVDFEAAGIEVDEATGLIDCARSAIIAANPNCMIDVTAVGGPPPTGVVDIRISGCTFADLLELFSCSVDTTFSVTALLSNTTVLSDDCSNGTPGDCVSDVAGGCNPQPTTTTSTSTSSTSSSTSSTSSSTSTSTSSTSSTSSSSTIPIVTTTTIPTTTTTMGGGLLKYCLTFQNLPASPPPFPALGALQFDVDYSLANGDFMGLGDQVMCVKAAGFGALEAFNDDDAMQTLTQGYADSNGWAPPQALSICIFEKADTEPAPLAGDFGIAITDASLLQKVCMTSGANCNSDADCVPMTMGECSGATTANVQITTIDQQVCGDSNVNCLEQCDPPGGSCDAGCQCTNTCGDQVVEAPCEECDPGGLCQFGTEPPNTRCDLTTGVGCTDGFCLEDTGDSCDSNCLDIP